MTEDGKSSETLPVWTLPVIRGCRFYLARVYSLFTVGGSAESGWRKIVRLRALGMRFNLVDRILEVQPGKVIRTVKYLTMGEEYLADHFPTFPVMPGVLMLQTVVEASAWLWRITDEFRHSIILLREAKNVKYGQFMEPGRKMIVTAELIEENGDLATFKGKGEADRQQTVSARITLGRYNLADRNPDWRSLDERIVKQFRDEYTLLKGDLAVV